MAGLIYQIKVPASTANLGPGFDSIGLALGLYLEVEAQKAEAWEVLPLSAGLEVFPKDESHYICRVALETAQEYGVTLPPCRLLVKSEIPLTRGLGSSASAIVAGVELADSVGGLNLSREDKMRISSRFEGHPDNAGASVCGGLVVGVHNGVDTELLSIQLEGVSAIAVIPQYDLPTDESRQVLPDNLPFRAAIEASAVANTFLAALLTRNYSLAGRMMGADLFHQPYRRQLVPHLEEVERAALKAGAIGTALSGAGPTVICLVEKYKAQSAVSELKSAFPACEVLLLEIDHDGSQVKYKNATVSQADRL
ncbi:homoserine kinase [Peribacillus sp. SCS-37]|uniref:homoserine kinase n=1 Tax=Paraperibacillus esterisolvens TaxID=3115296 RepID=UPI003906B277